MKRKLDISFVLGIFTSSVLVWLYLYQLIIDITTDSPADLSILYLGAAHYISFLCLLFSFILLFRYGMEHALPAAELAKLQRFNKLADGFQQLAFMFWAPMLGLSITSVFFAEAFSDTEGGQLNDVIGYFLGLVFCIVFFVFILKLNLFAFISKVRWYGFILLFSGLFAYVFLLSGAASGVKVTVEKPFYRKDEVVRFQVLRKGYIFLPHVKHILFNFYDTVKPSVDYTYYINLKKYPDLSSSVVQIEYESQGLGTVKRKYVYLGVTPE